MSKIQKAIRQIEKSGKPVETAPKNFGTLVSDEVDAEIQDDDTQKNVHLGEETRQIAGLDEGGIKKRIQVDREQLKRAGFIAPQDEERLLIDQYRQIKRPLLAHAFGKRATKIEDGHLILVTSALSGDGKTFSCINLALSLAREEDRSVLLVDADVAKEHISRLFGVEHQPGLLDLLEKNSQLNLNDAILKTDIDGLSILPAGDMRSHSTELLASNRMERLIKALGAQDNNRIVVFDSSPLLSTSEARVLATLVGQIVMVVCASKTPRSAVLEAIGKVDEGKALNLVLNQVRSGDGGEYYAYGYGYGDDGENRSVTEESK